MKTDSWIQDFLGQSPWIWSYLVAAVMAVITVSFSDASSGGELLTASLSFATFFALTGVAQLFIITLGPGNIDLSIPANINLSAAVAMQVMNGSDAMIAVGILACLLTGTLIGSGNYLLISVLRIPPIIATLAASFVIQSIAIAYAGGYRVQPPELLKEFVRAKIGIFPIFALSAIVLTVALATLLHKSRFGRAITAIGQNKTAASLANIKVERVQWATYVLSAAIAAFCSIMLAAFSGGSSLEMGNEYLLSSIAVVVIGGTAITGGRSFLSGVWGASLFLFLLITMLNTLGASPGLRLLMMGLIIFLVVFIASVRDATAGYRLRELLGMQPTARRSES